MRVKLTKTFNNDCIYIYSIEKHGMGHLKKNIWKCSSWSAALLPDGNYDVTSQGRHLAGVSNVTSGGWAGGRDGSGWTTCCLVMSSGHPYSLHDARKDGLKPNK